MFYCDRDRLSLVKKNSVSVVWLQFGIVIVGFDSWCWNLQEWGLSLARLGANVFSAV